jgi:hypothetical protein
MCHSRESGNPEPRHARPSLDTRFRGHDTDVSESSSHFERLTRLVGAAFDYITYNHRDLVRLTDISFHKTEFMLIPEFRFSRPCNLLKSHKTTKAFFGKAWR